MSIRKSLAFSLAQRYVGMAIGIAASVVLARILTPEEIGIYSVGYAVIAILQALRDFGVGRYLIQERDLTVDRIRTAFGVALLISWFFAALIFVSRGPAAEFYRQPLLVPIFVVLAVNFLLIPIGALPRAMLNREMDFRALFVINTSGAAAQAIASVSLAAAGIGPISLAWGSLAGLAVSIVVTTAFAWRHTLVWPSLREWRRVLGFGSMMSGLNVIYYSGESVADLVLGRMLGFHAVGIYSRAQGLLAIQGDVLNSISAVWFPALSKEHREGRAVGSACQMAAGYVLATGWPLYAMLFILAHPLILFLFGEQWLESVRIAQILILVTFVGLPVWVFHDAFLALGRIRLLFFFALAFLIVRALLLGVGALYSLETAAALLIIPGVVGTLFFLWLARREFEFSVRALLRDSVVAAIVTCMVAAGPIIVTTFVTGPDTPFLTLMLGGATGAVGWLGAIYLVRHPLRKELERVLISGRTTLRSWYRHAQ